MTQIKQGPVISGFSESLTGWAGLVSMLRNFISPRKVHRAALFTRSCASGEEAQPIRYWADVLYRVLDLIARQGNIESTVFHVKLRWLPGFLKLAL
jgi:hypothetical protein